MDSRAGHWLLRLCWSLPYLRLLSSRKTVILLYHGVPRQSDSHSINGSVFERHILFLKRQFEIIPLAELKARREPYEKNRLVLTFDDGFRNHADLVAPILKKHNVPATFFVCSRSSIPGKYLWFAYLQALEDHFPEKGFYFREKFFDMSLSQRHVGIEQLRNYLLSLDPHPIAMYETIERELPRLEDCVNEQILNDRYAGITAEQMNELSRNPLFSIGVHTCDHPFLSKCERAEARRQILDNKNWIERILGKPCDFIAYPSGDYNAQVLDECRQLGLKRGYAVIPQLNTDAEYELPRVGIYSTSLEVLGFKAQWGDLLRAMKIKVG